MRDSWIAWAEITSGLRVARAEALPRDAGRRTYLRVWLGEGTVILCHFPEFDLYQLPRFLAIRAVLAAHEVPVPEVLEADYSSGLVMMSDLGRVTVRDCLSADGGYALDGVYRTLATLQSIPAARVFRPTEGVRGLRRRLNPFFQWYLPALFTGAELATVMPAMVRVAQELCVAVEAQPSCVWHGDFHSRNLVCRPHGDIAVVDFQDATVASCYLDLAALIFDQNHVRDRLSVKRMIGETYWQVCVDSGARPVAEREYRANLVIAAAYWVLRLLGVCARLALRDGRPGFELEIRNCLRNLGVLIELWPLARRSLGELQVSSMDRIDSGLRNPMTAT